MATESRRQELLRLEHEFWDAMKEADAATAARLTADPCVLVGAQGASTIQPRVMTEMLEHAPYKLNSYAIDASKLQLLEVAPDTVIVAYPVQEKVSVDGQDITLDAADSSVWQQQNGEWRCVLHTESISGDPFGRDRRAA